MNNLPKKILQSRKMHKPGENNTVLNSPLSGPGKSFTHRTALLIALIISFLPSSGHRQSTHTLLHHPAVAMTLRQLTEALCFAEHRPRASSALKHRSCTNTCSRRSSILYTTWSTTSQGAAQTLEFTGSKHNFQPQLCLRLRRGTGSRDHCRKAASGTINSQVLVDRTASSGPGQDSSYTHCLLEETK